MKFIMYTALKMVKIFCIRIWEYLETGVHFFYCICHIVYEFVVAFSFVGSFTLRQ